MKKYYLSKTLWLSLATFCTGMGDLVASGQVTWQSVILMALGVVMGYLRTVTDTGLTK